MDGNGRWALARGKQRTEGHLEGIKSLRKLVDCAIRYKISYLTVFSFSSENWRRPKSEVDFIFKLLKRFVDSDLEKLIENNVRVRILGDRDGLELALKTIIAQVEEKTKANTGLNLNVAFNYGGRLEIAAAMKNIGQDLLDGKLKISDITEDLVSSSLFTAGIPDPDLLIRTGGEQRTSNFLVWQAAYAELVFMDVLWPQFDENSFVEALEKFSSRQRRFGGIETVK
ncbi:Undecaprenyl diphosphate synthase [hydrothermal vent metagenome]|uniref:Undecaprenyl diphosphate synthase n=1 Tax=hydrothermal vent metagenome TaxID=652676 RepID=A0A3B0UIF4_9ZZZZ